MGRDVRGAGRSARPHWAPLARALVELGPAEMARRWTQARRLIRENGVTYNVYGDPQGMDRPWELDAVPLLVPAGRVARPSKPRSRSARSS